MMYIFLNQMVICLLQVLRVMGLNSGVAWTAWLELIIYFTSNVKINYKCYLIVCHIVFEGS